MFLCCVSVSNLEEINRTQKVDFFQTYLSFSFKWIICITLYLLLKMILFISLSFFYLKILFILSLLFLLYFEKMYIFLFLMSLYSIFKFIFTQLPEKYKLILSYVPFTMALINNYKNFKLKNVLNSLLKAVNISQLELSYNLIEIIYKLYQFKQNKYQEIKFFSLVKKVNPLFIKNQLWKIFTPENQKNNLEISKKYEDLLAESSLDLLFSILNLSQINIKIQENKGIKNNINELKLKYQNLQEKTKQIFKKPSIKKVIYLEKCMQFMIIQSKSFPKLNSLIISLQPVFSFINKFKSLYN